LLLEITTNTVGNSNLYCENITTEKGVVDRGIIFHRIWLNILRCCNLFQINIRKNTKRLKMELYSIIFTIKLIMSTSLTFLILVVVAQVIVMLSLIGILGYR
jgi:hypothetical protein